MAKKDNDELSASMQLAETARRQALVSKGSEGHDEHLSSIAQQSKGRSRPVVSKLPEPDINLFLDQGNGDFKFEASKPEKQLDNTAQTNMVATAAVDNHDAYLEDMAKQSKGRTREEVVRVAAPDITIAACDWIVPKVLAKDFGWPVAQTLLLPGDQLDSLRRLHDMEQAGNAGNSANVSAPSSSKKHKREPSLEPSRNSSDAPGPKKFRVQSGESEDPWKRLQAKQEATTSSLDALEQRMWQHLAHRQERILLSLKELEKLHALMEHCSLDDLLKDEDSKKRKPDAKFLPFEETFALADGNKRTKQAQSKTAVKADSKKVVWKPKAATTG